MDSPTHLEFSSKAQTIESESRPSSYSANHDAISCQHLSIFDLPTELIIHIFKFLPVFELIKTVPLVCKFWQRLALNPVLGLHLKLKGQTPADVCLKLFHDRPLLLTLRSVALKCLPSIVPSICRFYRLQCLNIGFCDLDERSALALAVNAPPSLRHLNVEGGLTVDKNFLKSLLARCKLLEALNLSHCINVTDESIHEISQSSSVLRRLNLDGIQYITGDSLYSLANGAAVQIGELNCIWLDGFELTTASLVDFLSTMEKRHLQKVSNLLDYDSSISSQNFRNNPKICSLYSNIGLRIFSISFCDNLEDGLLQSLSSISSLSELSLRKGRLFTSRALCDAFSPSNANFHLSSLKQLDLSDCPSVDDNVIEAICDGCGPNLFSLFLNWCWGITDVGLAYILNKCRSLRHLSMVGNHVIYGESLISLPTNQPYIRILNLTQCNQVIDSVLTSLADQMPDLYIFDYFGERVGGGLDDVCQYDLLRSINKVPICEH